MKFANKYELFEAVTTGRVETFFAKDLASGDRVLLHVFDAPEKKPDQPTVLWVLESFRKVAPNPPGLVLETGRYNGTTYAYVVTKLPDNAALQQWARSYEASVVETQETAIPSVGASQGSPTISNAISPPNERPAEESTPVRNANPLGDFTAAFSGSVLPVNLVPQATTSRETNPEGIDFGPERAAPRREPGDFTRQFFSGQPESPPGPSNEAPTKLGPGARVIRNREARLIGKESISKEKTNIETSGPGQTEPALSPRQVPSAGGLTMNASHAELPNSGGFTALFRSGFRPETQETSASAGIPVKPDDAKVGESTDIFRGPFDGDRPAATPNILPQIDAPQRKPPGEFTRVFGSGKEGPFTTMPPLEDPITDTSGKPGAFTEIFSNASPPPASHPPDAPSDHWESAAPKKETLPPPMNAKWNPPAPLPEKAPVTSSIEPMLSKPPVSGTFEDAEPLAEDSATNVFSVPGGGRGSSPAPLPTGPSEYTRIINGGMRGPAEVEEVPIAGEPQAPSGGHPGFKLPPPPAVPPAPKISVPPPPKFSPPAMTAAPKPPQLEMKPPKPKPAYLPLVIILPVLFIVAILLVMYFAMKH
jgi:hypothetical protein